jgi:hypothetical protein
VNYQIVNRVTNLRSLGKDECTAGETASTTRPANAEGPSDMLIGLRSSPVLKRLCNPHVGEDPGAHNATPPGICRWCTSLALGHPRKGSGAEISTRSEDSIKGGSEGVEEDEGKGQEEEIR